MGSYLYNTALILFLLVIYVLFHETQLYQEHLQVAKAHVEESAATGSQYFINEGYGYGYYNFLENEGIKAIEHSIKTNFNLNDDFTKQLNSGYWKDQLEYEVTFIDYESSQYSGFPGIYSFTHFGKTNEITLSGPSVIVTIKLGKQPYRASFLKPFVKDSFVTGIHTFED